MLRETISAPPSERAGEGIDSKKNAGFRLVELTARRGRQQKMKKNEKNFDGGNLDRKLARFWVEMKKCGLKIDLFSVGWSY